MAQIENEQYKTLDWRCCNCGSYKGETKIGLTVYSFWPPYIHCNQFDGCNRYFDIKGRDVTNKVTRN